MEAAQYNSSREIRLIIEESVEFKSVFECCKSNSQKLKIISGIE